MHTLGVQSDQADGVLQTELDSFLIEISALILAFKDEDGQPLVNKILDKTGMKGTGASHGSLPHQRPA